MLSKPAEAGFFRFRQKISRFKKQGPMLLFNSQNEDFYWIGLKAVPGIGNVTFRRLLECFETPAAALSAKPAELERVKGLNPLVVELIRTGVWRRFADE